MTFRGLFVLGLSMLASVAHAEDPGRELAQRSVCLACHQVDTKRVGPSFRDIALRYAANEAAAKYLARTIRDGSRGLWGAIPMPAQRHVDPATALLLGEWIISLAPEVEKAPGNQGSLPESESSGSNAGPSGSQIETPDSPDLTGTDS